MTVFRLDKSYNIPNEIIVTGKKYKGGIIKYL